MLRPDLHCTLCPHCSPTFHSWYLSDWVVDSGASHHVTTNLAALALHASYTAFDNMIIGDGSGLSIANIGSFSLTSLPIPFFFFLMSYMCLSRLGIFFQSQLFMSITLLMFYSLTLYFRCRIVTWGSPWFTGSVETVSITSRSQSLFSLQP